MPFINGEGGPDGLQRVNDRLLAAARRAGRDVKSYVTQIIIIADSDEEADEASRASARAPTSPRWNASPARP
jgi:alkanesulfonate monooxygenase SsuD/methylene tetrahydromethanopterin reductase-like flavin-dependent oxidoreductase (luciferase family)